MKRLLALILLLSLSRTLLFSFPPSLVTVRDGRFYLDGRPYRYVGTNLWYAAMMASEGQGGNRRRLCQELDDLRQMGIDNVRVLVGGEGLSPMSDHIRPTLQPRPGEYNDTLLRGLDFLMAELGKRRMRAVLYLHNAWQWSGGYGTYLEWAGFGEPAPASVWNQYTAHHSQFVRSDSARRMALSHTRFIVSRKNTITGVHYSEDPALMAWEICNEPRAFARDSLTKACFLDWIREQSEAIKQTDPNHLVTTGSEGKYGCEVDMQLYERIHALPTIDYLCIHIWPYTWGWIGPFVSPNSEARKCLPLTTVEEGVDAACRETKAYIDEHAAVARRLGKPLVLEEFGYPRDGFAVAQHTPTIARDRYFRFVLLQLTDSVGLSGLNFWAWGGRAVVPQPWWHVGDPFTGDPPQEEQGLYSVFFTDTTTLAAIRQGAKSVADK